MTSSSPTSTSSASFSIKANASSYHHLLSLIALDGFTVWLTTSIWTFHLIRIGAGPATISSVWVLSQLVRALSSYATRWFTPKLPVLFLAVALAGTLPACIWPDAVLAHFFFALVQFADMTGCHTVIFGRICKRDTDDGAGGMSSAVRLRLLESAGSSSVTATWVAAYSISILLAGTLYSVAGFRPLAILTSLGLLSACVYHVRRSLVAQIPWGVGAFERVAREEEAAADEAGAAERRVAGGEPPKSSSSTTRSVVVFVTVWVLPWFFQCATLLLWGQYATLYQTKFGIGPAISSIPHMAGDIAGALCVYLVGRHKQWRGSNDADGDGPAARYCRSCALCLRTPNNMIIGTAVLGCAVVGMTSRHLLVVVICHITTGWSYVVLYRLVADTLLFYSPTEETHQKQLSYHHTMVVLSKMLAVAVIPFMYDHDPSLPFYVVGALSLLGSLVLIVVFQHRLCVLTKKLRKTTPLPMPVGAAAAGGATQTQTQTQTQRRVTSDENGGDHGDGVVAHRATSAIGEEEEAATTATMTTANPLHAASSSSRKGAAAAAAAPAPGSPLTRGAGAAAGGKRRRNKERGRPGLGLGLGRSMSLLTMDRSLFKLELAARAAEHGNKVNDHE